MSKTMWLCLIITVLIIGSVVSLNPFRSEATERKNTTSAVQASGITWNNTDALNTSDTIGPNINFSISPRTTLEYADYAATQNLNPSFPPFAIGPRIVTEYADYSTYAYALLQSYTGPYLIGLDIGSPVEDPLGGVPVNVNKTISFYITSQLSTPKNVTFSYKTSLNQTWQDIVLTYPPTWNLSTTAQVTILGQSQPCNVTYKIEAYNYRGDYAVNDNVGQYYVYEVIPEFPSILILSLLLIATLLGALIYRKKAHSSDNQ